MTMQKYIIIFIQFQQIIKNNFIFLLQYDMEIIIIETPQII
jgi:hypothetical protein